MFRGEVKVINKNKRMATRGSREPVHNLRYPEHRRDLGQQFLFTGFFEGAESKEMENVFDQRKGRVPFPLMNPPQSPPEKSLLGYFKWLFTLTQEERIRAGIYTGNESRDLVAASSIIIPTESEKIIQRLLIPAKVK